MEMSFPLRIQAIRSRGIKPRLYVNIPSALAAAIELEPGDQVEWKLIHRDELHLVRLEPATPPAKARK